MMGFLKRNGVYTLFSDEKQQKTRQRGGVGRPFCPKAGSMRRPQKAVEKAYLDAFSSREPGVHFAQKRF